MKRKNNKAFTLAEVLITIGIIGVVAAMTIPNLITKYQKKQTVAKLQKSISVLNQAYKLSLAEEGDPDIDDILNLPIEKYFSIYWAPYLKQGTYCKTYKDCGYSIAFFKKLDGSYDPFQMTRDANYTFKTNDGMIYSIQIRGYAGNTYTDGKVSTSGAVSVVIDINGSKGPNTWGKDVFEVTGSYLEGRDLQPLGYGKTAQEIDQNCRKGAWGRYCAEKIRRAGWVIDKSYPWK